MRAMKPVSWSEVLTWGAIAAALAVVSFAVHAHPPAMTDGDLAPWFQSLRTPSNTMSCCDQADGHIMAPKDVRQNGDAYAITIDGAWVPVPTEAILQRVDNPTGQYVAFWLPGTTNILCFVRPSET